MSRPPGERLRFYGLCRWLCSLWFRSVHRVIVVDDHHVPRSGGVLLVSNHQSFYDPPLIGSMIHWRQFAFMAQAYLFRVPVLGSAIRSFNAVPVSGSGSDAATIKLLIKTLAEGRPVLVFPEGSRTPDGAMHAFKRGALLLVRRAKCPVVPVAVEGAFDAWPRSRPVPRVFRRRLVVVYGEPIDPKELRSGDAMRILAREVDALRLRARTLLRERTGGRLPSPGPGDGTTAELVQSSDAPDAETAPDSDQPSRANA